MIMNKIFKTIANVLGKVFGGSLVNVGDTNSQESQGDSLINSTKQTTNNYYAPTSLEMGKLQEDVGKNQEKKINKKTRIDESISISLGVYIGIVKTMFRVGTRVHLEFAVFNNHERPKAVRGVLLKMNEGTAHLKLFFKVNGDGSRLPDPTFRLPRMINKNGGDNFNVEFENIDQELITQGSNKAKLILILDDDRLAEKEFSFEIDKAMIKTLLDVEKMAFQKMQPQVFDAMIKS